MLTKLGTQGTNTGNIKTQEIANMKNTDREINNRLCGNTNK